MIATTLTGRCTGHDAPKTNTDPFAPVLADAVTDADDPDTDAHLPPAVALAVTDTAGVTNRDPDRDANPVDHTDATGHHDRHPHPHPAPDAARDRPTGRRGRRCGRWAAPDRRGPDPRRTPAPAPGLRR